MNDLIRNVLGGIAGGPRDPYFNYTTLLLPGTGTNGAQNGRSGPAAGYRDGTFLDSSSNNFTITRNGNTTQGTFSPFSQTGWSNYFVSSYLQTPTGALPESTQNYTVEFWFYLNSWPGSFTYFISGTVNNSWSLYYNSSTQAIMLSYYGVVAVLSASKDHANLGAWNHLAIVRSSNNCAMWINGTRRATATDSNSFVASVARIGEGFSGIYISNARILRGTAIYDYTQTQISVPTAPLTAITNTSLLTCQSNRFVDNSSNNFTITVNGTPSVQAFSPFAPTTAYSAAVHGGSGYFDGTSDYLTVPGNAAFAFGTGDFTVGAWIYPVSARPQTVLSSNYNYTYAAGNWSLYFSTGSSTSLYFNSGSGNKQSTASVIIQLNEWTHVAYTRASEVSRFFVNGLQLGNSINDAFNYGGSSGLLYVGRQNDGTGEAHAYMHAIQVQKGIGYTALPIPTAPPVVNANTGLLLNFTNAAITDATAKNVLETVDGAQIKTTINNPFGAPSGSMYFDGSGDYLAFQNGPNLNFSFGTADFTIEGWIYLNTSTTQTLLDIYDANSSGRILLQINTNRQLQWLGQSGVTRTQTSSSIALSTWTHFSVCRASGSTRIFIGGTQGNTTYPDTNNYTCTTGKVLVGINAYDSAGSPLNGYISNLRITKGFARHTANFTPPTTPFALR